MSDDVFIMYIAELQTICKEYHAKICELESHKYDVEWLNRVRDMEVIVKSYAPSSVCHYFQVSELDNWKCILFICDIQNFYQYYYCRHISCGFYQSSSEISY